MPLAILIFLVMAIAIPGLPSGFYLPRWSILVVGSVCLLWAIRTPRLGFGHWCFLAYIGWSALGLFWSISPLDTLQSIFLWLVMGAVFLAASQTEDMRLPWVGFIAGMAVNTAIAAMQYDQGWFDFTKGNTAGLVVGTFLNKNILASLCVLALVPAVRYRWWGAVPLMAFFALQPESRTAYLMLAVVAAGLLRPYLSGRWFWSTGIAMFTVVAVWAVVDLTSFGRLISLNTRLAIWQIELANMTWLGWGLGTFPHLLPMYDYGHNEYLQVVFESGIGAVFLAAMLVYALGAKAEVENVIVAALLVECIFSFPLRVVPSFLVLAVASGYLCGCRDRARLTALGSRNYGNPRIYDGLWGYPSSYLRQAGGSSVDVPARSQHTISA